jgi:DNA-binding response OmpR family regulator
MAKILVIDDDRDVNAILKMALEKAGHQVACAMDAMQGTMLTRQLQPQLIVLDIMMPAGGGMAVYNRVRQMTTNSFIPILVYSAVGRDQLEQQIREDRSTMIMTKPAMPNEVVAAVNKLLAQE